ncbi:MAG: hypothetical protein EBS42_01935, partial [Caulobacteraceae bacterium]|nr:hypothetical protein [Caulobacteraceae bacterium]
MSTDAGGTEGLAQWCCRADRYHRGLLSAFAGNLEAPVAGRQGALDCKMKPALTIRLARARRASVNTEGDTRFRQSHPGHGCSAIPVEINT